MKNLKRVISIILLLILMVQSFSSVTLAANPIKDAKTEEEFHKINYGDNRTQFNDNDKVEADYGRITQTWNETTFEAFGNVTKNYQDVYPTDRNNMHDLSEADIKGVNENYNKNLYNNILELDKNVKGNCGVWARKAFSYDGQSIDVKTTYTNWKYDETSKSGSDRAPRSVLGGFTRCYFTNGIENIEMKVEFYKAGTDQKINIKAIFDIDDIDNGQGVQVTSQNIFVDKDSKLKSQKQTENKYNITSEHVSGITDICPPGSPEAPNYRMSFSHSGDSLTINVLPETGKDLPLKKDKDKYEIHYHVLNLIEAKVYNYIPTKINQNPVKTIIDASGKNVGDKNTVTATEAFTYDVAYQIPTEQREENFYKSVKFRDVIDPILEVKGIKVVDEKGADVTNLFTIANSNNTVTATAKNVKTKAFYGKTYHLQIQVQYKAGQDLAKYEKTDKTGITFKNAASILIDEGNGEKTINTGNVITTIPYQKVTVNYLDKTTKKQIATSFTQQVLRGDSYDVSNQDKKEIEKYIYNSTDGELKGIATTDRVINVYYLKEPVPENEEVIKTVTDIDEVNKYVNTTDVNETFMYEVSYKVAGETVAENFYKSFEFTDEITEALTVEDKIVILDENKKDVTELFEIETSDNKVSAKLKDPSKADFYNHTYTMQVKVKYNEKTNEKDYLAEDKTGIVLKNQARVIITDSKGQIKGEDGKGYASNNVETKIPYVTIDIKYIDKETNQEMGSEKQEVLKGKEYDVTKETEKQFTNYTKDSVDGEIKGVANSNKEIKVYYVKNKPVENKQDPTVAPKVLPKAGGMIIVPAILIVAVIAVVLYFKQRKIKY